MAFGINIEDPAAIKEIVAQVQVASKDVIDHAALKVNEIIRNAGAIIDQTLMGWELSIPAIQIKLNKKA